jgi:hypothetical protein
MYFFKKNNLKNNIYHIYDIKRNDNPSPRPMHTYMSHAEA